MKSLLKKLLKFEFEYRIFISLGIVLLTCFVSFRYFPEAGAIIQLIFSATVFNPDLVLNYAFLFLAFYFIPVSMLRMWAGSLLSSARVMSFKIVDDLLVVKGPYKLTRNPIYLSDLAAITGFALCLPLPGILMPLLFYIHYRRLIKYEEEILSKNFKDSYNDFLNSAPLLIPDFRSIKSFFKSDKDFFINADGFKNNSLYILFIPGLIAAAVTGSFVTAIIIGAPGVIYWAVVHTKTGTGKNKQKQVSRQSKIFDGILYAQCWEDPKIDRVAFNIKEDDVVFSITSGGCNVLTFLIDNPKEVIALDLNPHQNYLLELKMAAIRILPYQDCLAFLGVTVSHDRNAIYNILKDELSGNAKRFWDNHPELIKKGLIHCGRYENYMNLLRKVLNILIGRRNITRFFNTFGCEALNDLYENKWNNLRWKFFTKLLLSRKTMSLLFDKNFFTYVPDSFSFGDNFAVKTRIALTRLPVRSNYFLSYILLGNYFDLNNLPCYLRKENYDIVKKRLNRIKIVNDSCENFFCTRLSSSINKFNFTNIFEWMPEDSFENLLKETIRVSANKGIMTYRNLLVPRERPLSLGRNIKQHKLLSEALHQKDLSFIYNNYIIEEIVKEEDKCHTGYRLYQEEKS